MILVFLQKTQAFRPKLRELGRIHWEESTRRPWAEHPPVACVSTSRTGRVTRLVRLRTVGRPGG